LGNLFEGLVEQWQVGSTGQVEMSHTLGDGPASRISTLRPPRIWKMVGEHVQPGLGSVALI
jgi:hypothetical protein